MHLSFLKSVQSALSAVKTSDFVLVQTLPSSLAVDVVLRSSKAKH